jgi:C1A family cysteine protease
MNTTEEDSGAFLSDGIKSLKYHGICEEKYWSYIIENVFKEPSKEAYINAENNYVIEAFNISNNINTIKKWLLRNEPIAMGMAIYSNFTNNRTGIINLPSLGDEFLGGHAIIICGFDDKNKKFIMRNSWGSYWGDKGYFYLPYDYVTNNDLCGDLWVITRIVSSQ